MIKSPPASTLPAGALSSPNSAIHPSVKAIQPRSITRSARTILAFPITVSELIEVISKIFPSYRCSKRCHVDNPVGDLMAYLIVVYNRHHGSTAAFLLSNKLDHHRAIGRVERSGRLVEQQDR